MDDKSPHNRSRGHSATGHGSRPRAESLQPRLARLKAGAQPRYRQNYQTSPADAAARLSARTRKADPRLGALQRDGKLRWEVYFVIGVIIALALIFGAGAFIAAEKAKPALDRSLASPIPQAQADSGSAEPPAAEPKAQPAANNAAPAANRDAEFAVDPQKDGWNYGSNGRKTIYLTIDDGPSENTAQVLDILDRYGCKATFFVVGHNEEYFPMIAEAYRRGHTIGMHTYSHDYAQVYSSPEAYFADLEAISNVVREQIGYVPCFIRFPGGSSNEISADYTPGIMTQLADDVQKRGFQYWDWNISVGDGDEHTTEEIVGYGTEPLEAENIVLLCHDSATKQTTVEALPAIIEHYQGLGYSFEALDRTSWVCHHDIMN